MTKLLFVFFAGLFCLNTKLSFADPMTVLAMGDSTTAGTPAFRSPVEAPPAGRGNPESQYTYWLGKKNPQWQILNRGVNGERTDQISRRLEKDLKEIKPQMVILLAGINDLYQGFDTGRVSDHLKEMYNLIGKSGARVVVCTILPYDEASTEVLSRIQEVNGWIKSYAVAKKYIFCDTYQAVENPSKPGKLIGSPDGLHPDVDAYRKMGEAIAEVFKKELQGTNGQ